MKDRIFSGRTPNRLLIKVLVLIILPAAVGCTGSESTTPTKITLLPDLGNNGRDLPETYTPKRTNNDNQNSVLVPAGWIPTQGREIPGRWEGIMIHHSGSFSGNAREFDRLHRQRDWDGLGYHFVINNGHGGPDGRVEVGYRWGRQLTGAHCREANGDDNYWNEHTIGICLVGNFEQNQPTPAQYEALARLIKFLQKRYGIPTHKIIGHEDVKPTACPGRFFSWEELHRRLRSQ